MSFIYIWPICKRRVLTFHTKNVNVPILPQLQILFQKHYSGGFNLIAL